MNERQAKALIDVMSNRQEIFNVFRFWVGGQPIGEASWSKFLREIADALDAPVKTLR